MKKLGDFLVNVVLQGPINLKKARKFVIPVLQEHTEKNLVPNHLLTDVRNANLELTIRTKETHIVTNAMPENINLNQECRNVSNVPKELTVCVLVRRPLRTVSSVNRGLIMIIREILIVIHVVKEHINQKVDNFLVMIVRKVHMELELEQKLLLPLVKNVLLEVTNIRRVDTVVTHVIRVNINRKVGKRLVSGVHRVTMALVQEAQVSKFVKNVLLELIPLIQVAVTVTLVVQENINQKVDRKLVMNVQLEDIIQEKAQNHLKLVNHVLLDLILPILETAFVIYVTKGRINRYLDSPLV